MRREERIGEDMSKMTKEITRKGKLKAKNKTIENCRFEKMGKQKGKQNKRKEQKSFKGATRLNESFLRMNITKDTK